MNQLRLEQADFIMPFANAGPARQSTLEPEFLTGKKD